MRKYHGLGWKSSARPFAAWRVAFPIGPRFAIHHVVELLLQLCYAFIEGVICGVPVPAVFENELVDAVFSPLVVFRDYVDFRALDVHLDAINLWEC